MKNSTKHTSSPRLTFGLLIEDIAGHYGEAVFTGALAAAREIDCNLICYPGGLLRNTHFDLYEVNRNYVFKMATPAVLDGVVITGSIGNLVEPRVIRRFLTQLGQLPKVGIPPALGEYPCVSIDEQTGMRHLMEHLIQHHGYRRFAFIEGPKGNKEALERYDAFRESLRLHDIAFDEQHLLYEGDYTGLSGEKAARGMVESDRPLPDAVVAVNDSAAMGVIRELTRHGIATPGRCAVVGFDNLQQSRLFDPPLTTIDQPFDRLGYNAVLLLEQAATRAEALDTAIPTRLLVRRSCGCSVPKLVSMQPATLRTAGPDTHNGSNREHIADLYRHKQNPALQRQIAEQIDRFLESWAMSAISGDCTKTVFILDELLQHALEEPDILFAWYSIIKRLRRGAEEYPSEQRLQAQECADKCQKIIGMSLRWESLHRSSRSTQNHLALLRIGRSLSTAFSISGMMEALENELGDAGVRYCYLGLYEHKKGKPVGSRLHLAHPMAGVRRDETLLPLNCILPDGLRFPADRFDFVIEPLYYRDSVLGYMAISAEYENGRHYEALAAQISAGLYGATLVEQIQRQADNLSRMNEQITSLREKEQQYLKKIKDELHLAHQIQESFLPSRLPAHKGWEFAVRFKPAHEVAGDFYDMFMLDDYKTVVSIADVCGKGLGSALFMALVRSLIRSLIERTDGSPQDLVNVVSDISTYVVQHHRETYNHIYLYVTLFIGILDMRTGQLDYVNAGHLYPYVIKPDGAFSCLKTTGVAVGFTTGENLYSSDSTVLEPGELLFGYTDGIIDARDDRDALFGKEGLERIVSAYRGDGVDAFLDKVNRQVDSYSQSSTAFDDITMVAIARKSPPTS